MPPTMFVPVPPMRFAQCLSMGIYFHIIKIMKILIINQHGHSCVMNVILIFCLKQDISQM